MIGKYVVYVGHFRDHYKVSLVKGETDHFWKMATLQADWRATEPDRTILHRVQKAGFEALAVFSRYEDAEAHATLATKTMRDLTTKHREEREAAIEALKRD